MPPAGPRAGTRGFPLEDFGDLLDGVVLGLGQEPEDEADGEQAGDGEEPRPGSSLAS